MKPILFKIGEFTFPSYTFLIMIGILVGTYLGLKLLKRQGLPVIYGLDMAIIGIVVGFLGGRIGHVLVEPLPPGYSHYYLENPLRFFYFWQGGFVSWSSFLSIFIVWYFYLRWRKQLVWAYFDVAALVIPLAYFFGRGGCLLTGCCFGKPTDFLIHLVFKHPASTAYYFFPNVPLHATQIYLMLNGLIISGALWIFSKKWWRFQGELFAIGLGIYALLRFGVEFLRGDVDRGVYFGGIISAGQFAMLGYLLVSVLLYFYLKKKSLPIPKNI